MKYLVLFIGFLSLAQGKKFIPLDEDTLEFIGEVNYTLYSNTKPIYCGLTSKDSITMLPKEIVFDSIAFRKLNYNETGLKTVHLENVVRLKKKIYELDEVIISKSKPKETLIGETSRFVKRQSRVLFSELNYGLLFRKNDLEGLEIKSLDFFVEKVVYKTTYKIKFYATDEIGNFMTNQYLRVNELLFESEVLTLAKGTKDKVEVNLEGFDNNINGKNVLVCLELQAYYDENNAVIQPPIKEQTRLKFQLSNLATYYSRMYYISTKMLTPTIFNMNAMINRDFAFMFFKKPHKSELVAPAIQLYGTKRN